MTRRELIAALEDRARRVYRNVGEPPTGPDDQRDEGDIDAALMHWCTLSTEELQWEYNQHA